MLVVLLFTPYITSKEQIQVQTVQLEVVLNPEDKTRYSVFFTHPEARRGKVTVPNKIYKYAIKNQEVLTVEVTRFKNLLNIQSRPKFKFVKNGSIQVKTSPKHSNS